MKRTVFLVLALFALMAVGVYAQTEADFTVRSGRILEYKGEVLTVNIPAKINNVAITTVGGFTNRSDIKSVTIPNGVTTISQGAFGNCWGITSITIPASVTSIGSLAFQGCRGLTSVTFAGSIPSSGFDEDAFDGLGDIRAKYLAAGGGAGTYNRPNGTSTTWTKGTATAATPAATGTPGLAFAATRDGKGYSVSKGTATNVSNVVIPASYNNLPVTEVANLAFSEVLGIWTVIIPNSVTRVGQGAFSQCIYLDTVTLGSDVQEIAINAFRGCQRLTSVTFQSTIISDGFHSLAFDGLGDLRAKYLAGGVGTYTRPNGTSTTWTKK